jgi:deoxyribodipyrimidine photo-lyase
MLIDERTTLLQQGEENRQARYVLYWMQMFKRATHNHALNFAIRLANERKLPLVVYEGLKFYYPWANDRIHTFILEGVEEKRIEFEKRGIRYIFYLQKDRHDPRFTVAQIAKEAAAIITDDFPCFIIPEHNKRICEQVKIPVYAVDANGMIPMSKFEKEEYAAYTIRPKIKRFLPDYLEPIKTETVNIKAANLKVDCPETIIKNIKSLVAECAIDHSVKPSPLYHGGTNEGRKRLKHFVEKILPRYDKTRNESSVDGSSRLSPYLHFGFLSVNEIVEAVNDNTEVSKESRESFLEELIVRRELSYNFTRHNPKYDSLESLPAWVQQTMREHIEDIRPDIQTSEQIESAETYDELWNAAQRELIETGLVHNYMRMLWGKLVIQWRPSYEEAFALLEHLNNKYALDGRNPNSYAGILWCFGKHDRPWFERPIFGKMRYMTSASMARKIKAKDYIAWTKSLSSANCGLRNVDLF